MEVNLRVGVVQVNPQIGEVEKTSQRIWDAVDELDEKLNHDQSLYPDLIVFPEFTLTGYHFESREQILPYTTTDLHKGPAFELALRISKKFDCYTVIGMPQRLLDPENNGKEILYNSLLMVDKDGNILCEYKKYFLYTQDYIWGCEENPEGFQNYDVKFKGKGTNLTTGEKNVDVVLKTGLGICMDLSSYKFEAPFHDFEFSTWHLDHASELMIVSMSWIHSASFTEFSEKSKDEATKEIQDHLKNDLNLPRIGDQGNFQFNLNNENTPPRIGGDDAVSSYDRLDEPDMQNLNYWILRFTPFVSMQVRNELFSQGLLEPLILNNTSKIERESYIGSTLETPWGFHNKQAGLIIANRCGIEQDCKAFAGSSSILKFNGKEVEENTEINSTNKSVEILGSLGKGREGILIRDLKFIVNR